MTPHYSRLADLMRVVAKVPAELFDMNSYYPKRDCGCAKHHYDRAFHAKRKNHKFSTVDCAEEFGIKEQAADFVFNNIFDYPHPTGNLAKIELVRRVRKVLGWKPGPEGA